MGANDCAAAEGTVHRSISPGFNVASRAHASKEQSMALVGRRSGLPTPLHEPATMLAGGRRAANPGAKPAAAPLPGGLRPGTSMSLRDRAYLKSSTGNRAGEQRALQVARLPLPNIKVVPPLDLTVAVGLMGHDKGPQMFLQKQVLKLGNGKKVVMAGLPPRPESVTGISSSGAARNEALLVSRPHSVAGLASGFNAASPPLRISFVDHVGRSALSSAHNDDEHEHSPSRSRTALEPLRLNTAELVRQNEILRQENEELRQLAVWDMGGSNRGGGTADTAASRRSGTLTAMSNRSTVSSSWQSTHRSSVLPRRTAASNAMLTERSDLSTANSIKFIQGGEAPAEKRIKALEAEIVEHQQREETLRASLLAANTLPLHENEPVINIQMHGSSFENSPSVRTSRTISSTSPSANPKLSRMSSVARTPGNLTPYPREGTSSSNSAVIGARLSQSLAQEGDSALNRQTLTAFRQSGKSAMPLTWAGPHAMTVHRGEADWIADGLKIDPVASNVIMSQSARLTYPAKRLQTLAHGGGGSYAYGVVGRGPIMVANGLPVPDGLMVRSPDISAASAHLPDGASELRGDTSLGSSQVLKKTNVRRGDAEANAWHCSQVTSALRWEARTRKFDFCLFLCLSPPPASGLNRQVV